MKKWIGVALVFSMAACSKKIAPQKSVNDSVVISSQTKYVETVRDSIIQLPADSSWLKALLACDSAGNVLIKQVLSFKAGDKLHVPDLELKDNTLSVKNRSDSIPLKLSWKEVHELVELQKMQSQKEVITPPPERINYITGWQKFFIKSGQLAWLLLISASAGWIISKRFKTF